MRGLAQVGAGYRLDVVGPAPAGLQDQAADVAAADVQQLEPAMRELAGLVGCREIAVRDLGLSRGGLRRGCLVPGLHARLPDYLAVAQVKDRAAQHAGAVRVAAGLR